MQTSRRWAFNPKAPQAPKAAPTAIRARLRNSGATPEECEFLVHQRVELNAMTSEQFVEFIKRKLTEHGVEKIVPSKQTLDEAYQLFERGRRLEETFDKVAKDLETADARAPDDIKNRVTEIMRKRPTLRWDAAVKEVLEHANPNEQGAVASARNPRARRRPRRVVVGEGD